MSPYVGKELLKIYFLKFLDTQPHGLYNFWSKLWHLVKNFNTNRKLCQRLKFKPEAMWSFLLKFKFLTGFFFKKPLNGRFCCQQLR